MWKVGDSSEKNGHFRVSFTEAKSDMVALKSSLSLNLKLKSTDAILLINIAWNQIFDNVKTNHKVTSNRGWCPFNHISLHHPELRATTTNEDLENENNSNVESKGCKDSNNKNYYKSMPHVSKVFLPNKHASSNVKLSFTDGFSTTFLDHIANHSDLHQAREYAQKRKNEGSTIKEMLSKHQILSVSNLVKSETNRLGCNAHELISLRRAEKE